MCLIEDGVIAELHLERSQHRGSVGNIVLGRVTRVLPGMQAAFIDIGMERAAFLHVEDLIRPDDFEAYLDKGDRREEEPSGKGDGSRRFHGRADEETYDDEDEGAQTVWEEEPDSDQGRGATQSGSSRASEDRDLDTEPEPEDVVLPARQKLPLSAEARQAILDEVGAEKSPAAALDRVGDELVGARQVESDAAIEEDELAESGDEHLELDALDESDAEEPDVEPVSDEDEIEDAEDDDTLDAEPSEVDSSEVDPLDDDSMEGEPGEDDSLETDAGEDDADEGDDGEEGDDEPILIAEKPNGAGRTHSGIAHARTDHSVGSELRGLEEDDSDVTEVSLPSMLGDEGSNAVQPGESEALPPQPTAISPQREGRGRRRRRRRKRNGAEDSQPTVQASPVDLAAKRNVKPGQESKARVEAPKVAVAASGRVARRNGTQLRGRGDQSRDRRGSNNKLSLARVSRSMPITEIVREGDEVVVQISKEPIGTKGARVTSHVSLPGRHVVYLPTVDHVGISKRIGSPKERNRLRQVIEALKPESGGLIVRTVAEGLTKKSLKTDIGYLIALWKEVSKKKAQVKAPAVLYAELDLVLKTARDLFNDDVQKIIIDDREQHARLVQFVEMFLPSRVKDIELYTGDEPIFDAYGIEDEIGRALGRKVPLPSGGYLVIDQAEALTAIDVNTGRFVGKGSKDLEETALKTNLEAVTEIAYQLRLRNIGGLVILDLIDMDHASNRDKVWRSLEQHLARDKAKTTINRISELGLIEMTRKRTRESLTRMLHEPCFYCDGTGQIQSRVTVAYEILRQVRRERHLLKGYSIVVNAHPAVIDLLQTEEKAAVQEAERRYMRRLELVPRREYHLEQFDLQGR